MIIADTFMPHGYKPMLCNEYDGRDLKGYVAEPKYDGIRCVAIHDCINRTTRLLTRSGNIIYSCAHIEAAINNSTGLPNHGIIVLDGELWTPTLSFDEINGAVRAIMHSPYSAEIGLRVFDMVHWINGAWNNKDTYIRRKYLLSKSIVDTSTLSVVGSEPADGAYERAVANGYEGVIYKRANSKYKFGRTIDWMKRKPVMTDTFVVEFFTEGDGKFKDSLGTINCSHCGSLNINKGIHLVGTGFDDATRQELWNNRNNLIGQKIEVAFQSITEDGRLRFPSFKRFI
jgi:ATP-dependent DNA ligase